MRIELSGLDGFERALRKGVPDIATEGAFRTLADVAPSKGVSSAAGIKLEITGAETLYIDEVRAPAPADELLGKGSPTVQDPRSIGTDYFDDDSSYGPDSHFNHAMNKDD